MNLFVFFVKLVSLFPFRTYMADSNQLNQSLYPAFKYNLSEFERYYYYLCADNVSHFTACPPSTEQEKKINHQFAITENSLFFRNAHGPKDNITLNICDKPVEPTVVYNNRTKLYEIGHEVYYERGTFKWFDMGRRGWHLLYKRINVTNNYEIMYNFRQKELNPVLHPDWIFNWVYALAFAYTTYNRQVILFYWCDTNGRCPQEYENRIQLADDAVRGKCEDYNLPRIDIKIYTHISSDFDIKLNQSNNTALPNVEELTEWNTQSYGSLKLVQVIPMWYYPEVWMKAASCSYMNLIPVWKSIAEAQVRKVDLYLQAAARHLKYDNGYIHTRIFDIIFGADGVLTVRKETDIDSDQQQRMYILHDNVYYPRVTAIPKIIYRVIEAGNRYTWSTAVVVIHNDPNPIPDSDRICNKSEELSGWEKIKNDDPRTGITYVCEYTDSIKATLVHKNLTILVNVEKTLKKMYGLAPNKVKVLRVYCRPPKVEEIDLKSDIDQEFEKLLNITEGLI